MAKRKLKTITLGNDDQPTVSIARGHITATEFNKRFKAEGWSGGGWISRGGLTHEHWLPLKSGAWKKVAKDHPRAVPVTVSDW